MSILKITNFTSASTIATHLPIGHVTLFAAEIIIQTNYFRSQHHVVNTNRALPPLLPTPLTAYLLNGSPSFGHHYIAAA